MELSNSDEFDDSLSPDFSDETVDALMPELWKRADVCALLRVSEKTLRRLIHAGRLPVVKLAGTDRFRPADIRRLINEGLCDQTAKR